MANQQTGNQITVWSRAASGQLTQLQTIGTNGKGSGIQIDPTDSLGSEGSLALDASHQFLFAVNTETAAGTAGDCNMGSISAFTIDSNDGWLTFVGKVPSGGLYPNSLTVLGKQVYVLNAGGPGLYNACGMEPNITGFQFDSGGHLTSIPSSTQSLNPGPMPGSSINPAGLLNCDPGGFGAAVVCGLNPPAFPRSPAEIGFTPDGNGIVVTVKGTNSIYMFPLHAGLPVRPVVWKPNGPTQPTYFGFAFDSAGNLVVAEPFGMSAIIPAKPASGVSSFSIGKNATMTPLTVNLPNGQALGCWLVLDSATGVAFVSNNGSGTISTYRVDSHGSLALLTGAAVTGLAGINDMAIARNGANGYLYALAAGAGTVNGWKINSDGSLTSLGAPLAGMPANAGAQGLAAF
jgi:6-phosphogluconolactonase (cycloisomerase 2 family)